MNRRQKEDVVADLSAALKDSQAVFLTDFKGLKVNELSGLRRKIGEAGGEYRVVKNTLFRLAAKGTGAQAVEDLVTGNNGMGMAKGDPVPVAKALVDYAKTNDRIVIKGGALGGKKLTFEQVKAMADLPSREVLLAMLFGTMNAVPTGFVRVLAAVPQKLVYALAAIRDQKEAPAA